MNDERQWYLQELIQELEEEFKKNSNDSQSLIVKKQILKDIKNLILGLNNNDIIMNYFIDYEEIFKEKISINKEIKQQLKNDNINMIKSKLNDNFTKFCQDAWLQCELTIVLLIENYSRYRVEEFQEVQTSCNLMISGERRRNNLDNYIRNRNINDLWMSNKITVCLLIIFRKPRLNEDYGTLYLLLNALYKLRCINAHRDTTIRISEKIEKIDDLSIKEKARQLYREKSYKYIKDKVKFFIFRASYWFPSPSRR